MQCGTAGSPDIVGANDRTTRTGLGTYSRGVMASLNTAAQRSGTITITGLNGGNTVSVTVTQAAALVLPQPA